MRRFFLSVCWMMLFGVAATAGFGVQLGAYSPTDGLDDNDNSLLVGANINFKFAFFGVKAEAFYVDSSGRYGSRLADALGPADIDIEAILAADFLYYPLGSTFFLQVGLNHVTLDASGIDFDVIDNELGYELGAGVTLLDKVMIQGKVMYTPDAVKSGVRDTLVGLDDNLVGYMVTVGWQF